MYRFSLFFDRWKCYYSAVYIVTNEKWKKTCQMKKNLSLSSLSEKLPPEQQEA